MFSMLTKQDKSYINDLLDRRFEELAMMIQKGFADCVTKTEFNSLKEEMSDMEDRLNTKIDGLDNRVYKLEAKLNTMEFKLITAPNNRLDKIEDDVRQIKAKVGMN